MESPKVDYTISYSGSWADGEMSGTYQIETAGGRRIVQQCQFGPGTPEQASYLTLVVSLGDLLVRIQKADKEPLDYDILVKSESGVILESIADADPKVLKLRERALGMLKRFGRHEFLDVTAVMV
jgi:hypothetical protein